MQRKLDKDRYNDKVQRPTTSRHVPARILSKKTAYNIQNEPSRNEGLETTAHQESIDKNNETIWQKKRKKVGPRLVKVLATAGPAISNSESIDKSNETIEPGTSSSQLVVKDEPCSNEELHPALPDSSNHNVSLTPSSRESIDKNYETIWHETSSSLPVVKDEPSLFDELAETVPASSDHSDKLIPGNTDPAPNPEKPRMENLSDRNNERNRIELESSVVKDEPSVIEESASTFSARSDHSDNFTHGNAGQLTPALERRPHRQTGLTKPRTSSNSAINLDHLYQPEGVMKELTSTFPGPSDHGNYVTLSNNGYIPESEDGQIMSGPRKKRRSTVKFDEEIHTTNRWTRSKELGRFFDVLLENGQETDYVVCKVNDCRAICAMRSPSSLRYHIEHVHNIASRSDVIKVQMFNLDHDYCVSPVIPHGLRSEDPPMGGQPSLDGGPANDTGQRSPKRKKRRAHNGCHAMETQAYFVFPESLHPPFHSMRKLCEQSDVLIQRAVEYFEVNNCFGYPRATPVSIVSKILGLDPVTVKHAGERAKGKEASEPTLPVCSLEMKKKKRTRKQRRQDADYSSMQRKLDKDRYNDKVQRPTTSRHVPVRILSKKTAYNIQNEPSRNEGLETTAHQESIDKNNETIWHETSSSLPVVKDEPSLFDELAETIPISSDHSGYLNFGNVGPSTPRSKPENLRINNLSDQSNERTEHENLVVKDEPRLIEEKDATSPCRSNDNDLQTSSSTETAAPSQKSKRSRKQDLDDLDPEDDKSAISSMQRKLTCSWCGQSDFATLDDLETHIVKQHFSVKALYECFYPKCSVKFPTELACLKHEFDVHLNGHLASLTLKQMQKRYFVMQRLKIHNCLNESINLSFSGFPESNGNKVQRPSTSRHVTVRILSKKTAYNIQYEPSRNEGLETTAHQEFIDKNNETIEPEISSSLHMIKEEPSVFDELSERVSVSSNYSDKFTLENAESSASSSKLKRARMQNIAYFHAENNKRIEPVAVDISGPSNHWTNLSTSNNGYIPESEDGQIMSGPRKKRRSTVKFDEEIHTKNPWTKSKEFRQFFDVVVENGHETDYVVCKVNDCRTIFRKDSGLRYHIEHVHNIASRSDLKEAMIDSLTAFILSTNQSISIVENATFLSFLESFRRLVLDNSENERQKTARELIPSRKTINTRILHPYASKRAMASLKISLEQSAPTEFLTVSRPMQLKPECSKCGQRDFTCLDNLETHIVKQHFSDVDTLYECLYPNCRLRFATGQACLKHELYVHLSGVLGSTTLLKRRYFVKQRLAIHDCLNQSINVTEIFSGHVGPNATNSESLTTNNDEEKKSSNTHGKASPSPTNNLDPVHESIVATSSISNPRMEISEPNNENNMRTEPENSSTSCVVKVGPNLINVMLTPLDPGISNNGLSNEHENFVVKDEPRLIEEMNAILPCHANDNIPESEYGQRTSLTFDADIHTTKPWTRSKKFGQFFDILLENGQETDDMVCKVIDWYTSLSPKSIKLRKQNFSYLNDEDGKRVEPQTSCTGANTLRYSENISSERAEHENSVVKDEPSLIDELSAAIPVTSNHSDKLTLENAEPSASATDELTISYSAFSDHDYLSFSNTESAAEPPQPKRPRTEISPRTSSSPSLIKDEPSLIDELSAAIPVTSNPNVSLTTSNSEPTASRKPEKQRLVNLPHRNNEHRRSETGNCVVKDEPSLIDELAVTIPSPSNYRTSNEQRANSEGVNPMRNSENISTEKAEHENSVVKDEPSLIDELAAMIPAPSNFDDCLIRSNNDLISSNAKKSRKQNLDDVDDEDDRDRLFTKDLQIVSVLCPGETYDSRRNLTGVAKTFHEQKMREIEIKSNFEIIKSNIIVPKHRKDPNVTTPSERDNVREGHRRKRPTITTPSVRQAMIKASNEGLSLKQIAKIFETRIRAVRRILKRWNTEGTTANKPNTGRKRKYNETIEQFAVNMIKDDPSKTATDIVSEIQKKFNLTISLFTIQKILRRPMQLKPECAKCGQRDFASLNNLETHIVKEHFNDFETLYECWHPKCRQRFPTEQACLKHELYVHLDGVTSKVYVKSVVLMKRRYFVKRRLAIHDCLNQSVMFSVPAKPIVNNSERLTTNDDETKKRAKHQTSSSQDNLISINESIEAVVAKLQEPKSRQPSLENSGMNDARNRINERENSLVTAAPAPSNDESGKNNEMIEPVTSSSPFMVKEEPSLMDELAADIPVSPNSSHNVYLGSTELSAPNPEKSRMTNVSDRSNEQKRTENENSVVKDEPSAMEELTSTFPILSDHDYFSNSNTGSAAASHQAKKSRTEISPQTSSKSYMIKDEPNLIDELAASIPGCSNHSDMLTLENADKITSALERKQRQQNLTKPKKTAIILGRLYQPKGVTCSISASSSISNPRMEISEPNNENNMRTEPENSSTSCVVKVGPNLINVMLTPLDPGISNNEPTASRKPEKQRLVNLPHRNNEHRRSETGNCVVKDEPSLIDELAVTIPSPSNYRTSNEQRANSEGVNPMRNSENISTEKAEHENSVVKDEPSLIDELAAMIPAPSNFDDCLIRSNNDLISSNGKKSRKQNLDDVDDKDDGVLFSNSNIIKNNIIPKQRKERNTVTTPSVRRTIIKASDEGLSLEQISKIFDTNMVTVRRILKRWKTEGIVENKPKSGRPRTKETVEHFIVNIVKEDPAKTARDIVSEIRKKFDLTISHNTVLKILKRPMQLKPECAKCGQREFASLNNLETHIVKEHFNDVETLYECCHPKCRQRFPTEQACLKHELYVHLDGVTSKVYVKSVVLMKRRYFVKRRLAIHDCLNQSVMFSVPAKPIVNNSERLTTNDDETKKRAKHQTSSSQDNLISINESIEAVVDERKKISNIQDKTSSRPTNKLESIEAVVESVARSTNTVSSVLELNWPSNPRSHVKFHKFAEKVGPRLVSVSVTASPAPSNDESVDKSNETPEPETSSSPSEVKDEPCSIEELPPALPDSSNHNVSLAISNRGPPSNDKGNKSTNPQDKTSSSQINSLGSTNESIDAVVAKLPKLKPRKPRIENSGMNDERLYTGYLEPVQPSPGLVQQKLSERKAKWEKNTTDQSKTVNLDRLLGVSLPNWSKKCFAENNKNTARAEREHSSMSCAEKVGEKFIDKNNETNEPETSSEPFAIKDEPSLMDELAADIPVSSTHSRYLSLDHDYWSPSNIESAAEPPQPKRPRTEISPRTSSSPSLIKDETSLIDELSAAIPVTSNHSDKLTLGNAEVFEAETSSSPAVVKVEPYLIEDFPPAILDSSNHNVSLAISNTVSNFYEAMIDSTSDFGERTEPQTLSRSAVYKKCQRIHQLVYFDIDLNDEDDEQTEPQTASRSSVESCFVHEFDPDIPGPSNYRTSNKQRASSEGANNLMKSPSLIKDEPSLIDELSAAIPVTSNHSDKLTLDNAERAEHEISVVKDEPSLIDELVTMVPGPSNYDNNLDSPSNDLLSSNAKKSRKQNLDDVDDEDDRDLVSTSFFENDRLLFSEDLQIVSMEPPEQTRETSPDSRRKLMEAQAAKHNLLNEQERKLILRSYKKTSFDRNTERKRTSQRRPLDEPSSKPAAKYFLSGRLPKILKRWKTEGTVENKLSD
ncbi:homeodomain-like domain-containing protein [Ditylenchus destructor]|uniref:Homeodomain-like domain-containing protein n=1 Tax=Ditylenchus destructor TaxID=166010 RepID=A0AAD4MML8_9BILA|nr:homeodomain-like domain-containing protein [Ditylenchus destructor]